jgi:phage/plasmid-associated DNA primase
MAVSKKSQQKFLSEKEHLKKIKETLCKMYDSQINDDTISYLFYLKYTNKYIYDIDNKNWYSINEYGIYKNENNELQSARLLIATELNKFLKSDFDFRYNFYKREDDKEKVCKMFNKIIKFISMERSKTNIIDAMKKYYGRTKIYELMNNINPYIFGFTNGVWDLKLKKFRNALPEELVSATTHYNYKKANEKYVNKLHNILKDIFPLELEKKHILKIISLGLLRINILEQFYIWTALDPEFQGANGKGLLETLIDKTFGDYCKTMSVDYLTKSKHGVSANAPDEILAFKRC